MALALAGCTSTTTHDLLEREVGRTIADATLVAGPPQFVADLPDGSRRYRWERELRHDERHSLRHQPGDEGNVAREPVELRDQHGASSIPRRGQCSCQLRAPVECVSPLPAFALNVLTD